LEAKFGGFAMESADCSFMISLFVVEFAEVVVLGMVFDHGIDDAGEFVGSGFDGELWAMLGLDPTVVGTEGALAVIETSRSEAEGERSAVGGFPGLGIEDFSSGEFLVGTEAESGGEVFVGGPFAHIDTGL
jgi:hypothetical protein